MNKSKSIVLAALSKHSFVLRAWTAVAASAFVLMCGLFALSYFVVGNATAGNQRQAAIFGISEVVCSTIIVLALFRYFRLRTKHRGRIFRDFIADNDWSATRGYDPHRVAATLLGATNYLQFYGYEGTYRGRAFTCVIFQFLTGSSEEKRFICLGFKLPKSYPMIVVDNKLNDNGCWRNVSNLPARIPKGVSIGLEGDFNKYYNVSTTKGSERPTVQVLSPDVMAALVDCASNKVDIEISDKDLFLIYESDFYTERNMKALFSTADAMLSELDELSRTWLGLGGWEEEMISKQARSARQKLIGGDLVGIILGVMLMAVALVWFTIAMVSIFRSGG